MKWDPGIEGSALAGESSDGGGLGNSESTTASAFPLKCEGRLLWGVCRGQRRLGRRRAGQRGPGCLPGSTEGPLSLAL